MVTGNSLWELVVGREAATPDGILAIDERGCELTFSSFRRSAERVAAGFQDLGVGAGTVVSWQLPTWIEAMVVTAALSRLGAVQNPLIPSYREREVGFIVGQTKARWLVVPATWHGYDYAAMAARVSEATPGLAVVVLDPDERALPEGDPGTLPPAPAAPVDPADHPIRWLYYTSGTTADPKGAQHTDATILATVGCMLQMLDPTPQDRASVVFPLAHIGGAVWLATSLTAGSTQLLAESFDATRTIAMLAEQGVTLAGTGTPFNLAYLAAQRALREGGCDAALFPHVRLFMSGASPKPPQLHHDLKAELGGTGIRSSYGLTECPMLTATPRTSTDEQLATTEGTASPGVTLRIVRPDGTDAEPGEEGEICATGGQLFRGYLDATLDADALDERGFLKTGDLGRLDADGFLTITGRLKDVIIRKGENISAKEIEDLLYEHPKVADVAVIGLPDDRSGERACAVVALAPGAEPLGFAEMQDHLRSRGLRTLAIPEQLELIDVVPRNSSGKIAKADLKRRYG